MRLLVLPFSQVEDEIYNRRNCKVVPQKAKIGGGKVLLQTIENDFEKYAKIQPNVNRQNIAKKFMKETGLLLWGEEDIDIGSGHRKE